MNTFGFDLKALEVFVTTAKTGNMTAAAQRLGLTQSSVSQTLATLEKNLKVELLDRTVRPVELTVVGRYFFDQSTHLLAQAEKTQREISKGQFQKLHLVRIALVDSLATSLGKPLIEIVKKRTENWAVSTGRSHMHAQALLSRNVDIIISDDALENNEDLRRHRILREPFVLVVPRSYQALPADLNQLQQDLDFVRYTSDSLIGASIERYIRRLGVEAPNHLQLDNTFAVLSTVAAGLGWTLTTPLCLYQSGLAREELTCLPIPAGEVLQRNLTLACRRNELGDLPQMMADDSRHIMSERFLPKVLKELPWLAPLMHIG